MAQEQLSERIIRKVRKLLNMAKDASSPHEAAIAAKQARHMMDKHQISELDVQDVGEDSFDEQPGTKAYQFCPRWIQLLGISVARLNDCKAAFDKDGRLVFQGLADDVAVATATLRYLVDIGTRFCKEYMKREHPGRYNARIGDSYKWAFADELRNRINEMRATRELPQSEGGTGMVVAKTQLVEAHFGTIKYRSSKKGQHRDDSARNARAQGRQDAKRVAIHNELDQ